MSDAIANALRIAAPNDMGGIERSLIEALRQKAAEGNPNAQAGVAQHDASMANPLWGSSTYLSQRPVNSLGEALQKVPPEVMFLSNFMGPKAPPPRVPNPIKAYHGSPHDFEKFDLSKIGTGEGAQAYGHGLYFAENEGVARSYREGLSKWKPHIDGVPIIDLWAEGKLPQKLGEVAGLERPDAITAASWVADAVRTGTPLRDVLAEKADAARRIYPAELAEPEIARINAIGEKIMPFAPEVAKGHTYEVAIHATPDQFLDWDKPLSQQSEAVRKALEPFGFKTDKVGMKAFDDALAAALEGDGPTTLPEQPRDPLGSDIVRKLHSQNGSSWLEPNKTGEGNATAALREQGVSGIRYLDQGSRGAGHGTSNFVVFDPSIIEILRKYGLLGPIAAGAVANSLGGDGNQ